MFRKSCSCYFEQIVNKIPLSKNFINTSKKKLDFFRPAQEPVDLPPGVPALEVVAFLVVDGGGVVVEPGRHHGEQALGPISFADDPIVAGFPPIGPMREGTSGDSKKETFNNLCKMSIFSSVTHSQHGNELFR